MNKYRTLFFGFSALLLAGCSSRTGVSSLDSSKRETNTQTSDTSKTSDTTSLVPSDGNTLIAYFSRTNNTEEIAKKINKSVTSDIFEIEAKVPYTDDDIKYYTDCRADREQNDPTCRPEIANSVQDFNKYSVIYLGYPIWHGQAPKIMYTFVESYDFNNKTIIPFCTSASSPIGSSATNLAKSSNGGNWLDGKRFSEHATENEVKTWIESLGK